MRLSASSAGVRDVPDLKKRESCDWRGWRAEIGRADGYPESQLIVSLD